MATREEIIRQKNVSDVRLCAFALTDCIVHVESTSAKYLRAVHRTALELAVPNLFGVEIGGFWLQFEQINQLRKLSECYPANEINFVRRAVEAYLLAQTEKIDWLSTAEASTTSSARAAAAVNLSTLGSSGRH